jgi:hypothetical protein
VSAPNPKPISTQSIEIVQRKCSKTVAESSARDYSALFHSQVVNRFAVTLNIKAVAREFSIPARVVNEILHSANVRRMVRVA